MNSILKLIIVDDEVFVRFGIKTSIDWNKIGYEIVGDAEDGQRALEMARATRPDVVLTDIIMPKMNGLELIKALKSEMPNTKVVVLSCHNDYDYVREAMQLWGAVDYLFKLSMQPKDLIGLMDKLKSVIEQERIQQHEAFELRSHMNSNQLDLRNKWFNDILDTKTKSPSFTDKSFMRLNVNLHNQDYVVLCLLIDDFNTVVKLRNKLGDIKLLIFSICNIVDEMLQTQGYNGVIFHRLEGEFGVILNLDTSTPYTTRLNSLLRDHVLPTLMKYLNISMSCGISNAASRLSNFGEKYDEAVQAAEDSIYSSKGSIHYYSDTKRNDGTTYYDGKTEQQLRSLIVGESPENIKTFIFHILDQIADERRLSPSGVLSELTEIVHTFSSVARLYNGSIVDLQDDAGHRPIDALSHCTTIDAIRAWFDSFIDKYIRYIQRLNGQKYSKEIAKAIDFIRNHYTASIKLKDIAHHIPISETYLSSLFRKETGQYFTDYLNYYRIEKAKELLKQGTYNVNEVGDKVGYASLSYFSRVFKQLEGSSPVDFKNFHSHT